MSLPYPHDRARARQEDGEQPFKDAREALNESESNLQRQAPADDGAGDSESEDQRHARQEAEASKRLVDIGEDVAAKESP